MPEISIIIINYNTKNLTLKCLKSIYQNKPKTNFEVWVVDNNSSDDSVEEIKKHYPQVSLLKSDKNLGFAGGNNLALKRVSSKYSLLLNSDTEIIGVVLDNLLNFAKTEGYDISSCKLINKEGKFQPNSGYMPGFFSVFVWLSGIDDILRKFVHLDSYQERNDSYYHQDREVGWVGGTAMLIKNELFKNIGYLDDKIFMYGEDVEFCMRAKIAGYKTGWTKKGEIMHLGGGSLDTPQYYQWRGEFHSLVYIFRKYYGKIASLVLRFLIYFFIFLRIISFSILGRFNYARTYAKIFISF